jgi:hypothetical protein
VAVWQATFQLVPTRGFPAGYHEILDQIVPRIRSWSRDVEWWGSEDGDRIDVVLKRGWPIEGLVRIDVRQPNRQFIDDVLQFAADTGLRLVDEHGCEVEPALGEFMLALRGSQAFRFVENPGRYVHRVPGDSTTRSLRPRTTSGTERPSIPPPSPPRSRLPYTTTPRYQDKQR